LAASWRHMVERHRCWREALTAVGTDRSMLLEKPSPSLGVGNASGRMRRELKGPVGGATLRTLLPASPPAAL
jgi:hypothetical protein